MSSLLHGYIWLALAACLTASGLFSAAAPAQTTAAHVEGCTSWDYRDQDFGTTNNCKNPVAVQFALMNDERVIQREIGPGEFFNTSLRREQIENSGWLFTACPVGHVPSVPISLKYADLILASLYNCIRK